VALADLGLAAATGSELKVVVGGLGLGYTAVAALQDARVATLEVIDALPAVIEWHRRGLLPVSTELTEDNRTALVLDELSDDPPDDEFMTRLGSVFYNPIAHAVNFDNALTGGVSSNTVYVATRQE